MEAMPKFLATRATGTFRLVSTDGRALFSAQVMCEVVRDAVQIVSHEIASPMHSSALVLEDLALGSGIIAHYLLEVPDVRRVWIGDVRQTPSSEVRGGVARLRDALSAFLPVRGRAASVQPDLAGVLWLSWLHVTVRDIIQLPLPVTFRLLPRRA